MAEVKQIKRVFNYGAMELVDPDPTMTPEAVLGFYANLYPELNQGVVEGGAIEGDTQSFTLRKAVGTKGQDTLEDFAKNPERFLFDSSKNKGFGDLTPEQTNALLSVFEHTKSSLAPALPARCGFLLS